MEKRERVMTRNRDRKPAVDWPGTDGPVWSETAGRWLFPLNAVGRATADGFLAKYPWPAACLHGSDPKLFRYAQKVIGTAGLSDTAADAVCAAAARYDPTRTDVDPTKYTFVVNAVRMAVRRACWEATNRVRAEVQLYNRREDDADLLGKLVGRADEPAGHAVRREREVRVRATLDRLGGELDFRTWQAVAGRYRYGLKLHQLGQLLGVSKERVRQLCNAGIERMRAAAGRGGCALPTPTPKTPGDDTPHTRSAPCRKNARTAASRNSTGRATSRAR